MPKPYTREFRDDVVAVARRGETPLKQVAKDFGISESRLAKWLRRGRRGRRPAWHDPGRVRRAAGTA